MSKEPKPDVYIKTRSKTSIGTGYVLDFGSKETNDQFKAAYDKHYKDSWAYGPYNNCSEGFARAMNKIVTDLRKVNPSLPFLTTQRMGAILGDAPNTPSNNENYIKKNLKQYTKCIKRYIKNSIPIIKS